MKHNATWRPGSLGARRLVAINSAAMMVRMRIAARLDAERNKREAMEAPKERCPEPLS